MIDCNFKCAFKDCTNTEIICMKINNWTKITEQNFYRDGDGKGKQKKNDE